MTTGGRILHDLAMPIARIQELSVAEKIVSIAGGALALIWSSVFWPVVLLLMAAQLIDWLVGSYIANKQDRWDDVKARLGLASKGLAVSLALLVFGTEMWAAEHFGRSTQGWASSGLALAFLVAELRSINALRRKAGGQPVRAIQMVLGGLDRLAEGFAGGSEPPPPPSRRDADLPGRFPEGGSYTDSEQDHSDRR